MVEIQMSAEGSTFSRAQMDDLIDLATQGVSQLVQFQKDVTS